MNSFERIKLKVEGKVSLGKYLEPNLVSTRLISHYQPRKNCLFSAIRQLKFNQRWRILSTVYSTVGKQFTFAKIECSLPQQLNASDSSAASVSIDLLQREYFAERERRLTKRRRRRASKSVFGTRVVPTRIMPYLITVQRKQHPFMWTETDMLKVSPKLLKKRYPCCYLFQTGLFRPKI